MNNSIKLSAVLVLAFFCLETTIAQSPFVGSHFFKKKQSVTDFDITSDKGESNLQIIGKVSSDFFVEFEVTPENSFSNFGIVLFQKDTASGWNYIGCETKTLGDNVNNYGMSHWFINSPNTNRYITKDNAIFYKDYKRHVLIEHFQNAVTIFVDGEKKASVPMPLLNKKGLHTLALKVKDGGSVSISNLYFSNISEIKARKQKPTNLTLSSESLRVNFNNSYPAVVDYYLLPSGKKIEGNTNSVNSVVINGLRFPLTSRVTQEDDKIVYRSTVKDIGVDFKTEFTVERNILKMEITEITESGDFKVKTIGFPNHDLVSVFNSDPQAMLSIAHDQVINPAVDVLSDKFISLANHPSDIGVNEVAIAILNTEDYAVTIDNNSIYSGKQVLCRTFTEDSKKKTSLFSNEWIYRGLDGKKLPLLWVKVIFAQDLNSDKIIDWQDAAIALAEVYPEPKGSDLVRNSYITITMNYGSVGGYPFLRKLDNLKKVYLATDEFGMLLLHKGYQSEGHDSGAPDYAGNYNRSAGGLRDLQILTEQAKKYNTLIGLHINQTEGYPEAKSYSNDIIVTDLTGWKWLDQSYLINREVDVLQGGFERRLQEMKKDLPHVGFVYIDTYRDRGYLAYNTSKIFNDNNWLVFTEAPTIFYREGNWVHGASHSKSIISRFVQHTFSDTYSKHPLFLGGYSRGPNLGFMGWGNGHDLKLALQIFFKDQLPYRYLMHYKTKKITDQYIKFEKGVVSEIRDGVHIISRNGKGIKRGNNLFIPWSPSTEDKIYHYNEKGGESSWELPDSWGDIKIAKFYKLDVHGRHFVKDIIVQKGSVTLRVEPEQAYVLYKTEAPAQIDMNWGEGGLIYNPGFDGKISGWTVNGSSIITEEDHIGNSILKMNKKGSASQQLILERGKNYVVSVWCKINGKGEATLSLGDEKYRLDETTVTSYVLNDKRNSLYQQIKFPYSHIGNEATLALSFLPESDTSYVCFDNVRIVKSDKNSRKVKGYDYFEDFENMDEGWGPFYPSSSVRDKTHLSERNEGYTDDVISGDWSLKTWNERNGEIYRTLPSMIRFKPNNTYSISFSYHSTESDSYRIVVRSVKDNCEVLNEALNGNNTFKREFKTGNSDDYYVTITKKGGGIFILDDFGIIGELDK